MAPYPVSNDPFGGAVATPPYAGVFIQGNEPDPPPDPEPEPEPFSPNAVDYSNSNYLNRADVLLNIGDKPMRGSVSFWANIAGTLDNGATVFVDAGYNYALVGFQQEMSSMYVWSRWFTGEASSFRSVTINAVIDEFPTDGNWHHVGMSFDDDGGMQLVIDGADQLDPSSTNELQSGDIWPSDEGALTNLVVGHQPTDTTIGLAQLWFSPDVALDWSSPAVLAKFYDAGAPVDLGADGSTPTGDQPALYFGNPAASVEENLGYAGAFTKVGAPVDSATQPGA